MNPQIKKNMNNFFLNIYIIPILTLQLIPNNINSQALLPIEVLGVNGAVEVRQFVLKNNLEAQFLYLQVNNFNYDGKVEVKINNQSNWTSLTNSNTNSDAQGNTFGGIGGGYSTLKTFVDLRISSNGKLKNALKNGVNTIHFRYNGKNDSKTIGYRILEFNFLKQDGSQILQNSDFDYDNPSTWKPIYGDTKSINKGKDLWYTKNLRDNFSSPKIINAKCTHCHSSEGEDLKYFNFSNKSIVERSKFHGLTQLEAEQIASYIRTLSSVSSSSAKMWDPPYQTGPELDSKPASEWSAGAGLDAVLDSDIEMLPYIFPTGTSEVALNKVFDLKETLNIREIPVAIQFPDWNDWLPEIHPIDMMSTKAYQQLINGIGGLRKQRPAGTYGYKNVKENLSKNNVEFYNNGRGKNLTTILLELGAGAQDFLFKDYIDGSGGVFWWTIKDSPGIRERPNGMLVETFKRNIAKWNAVKHWEIMQEFQIAAIKPINVKYAEERQWPLSNWTVFAIAPHIVGDKRGTSRLTDQTKNVGYYESSAWYQLQMTLNSGMRIPVDVAPVDWAYNFDHVTKSSSLNKNHKEPLRLIQNLLKAYQQRDNKMFNNKNQFVNNSAWTMREVSPWRVYSTAKGDTSLFDILDTYDEGLRAKLASKLLKMFNDKAASLYKDNWPRANDGTWYKLEKENFKPYNNSTEKCLFPNSNGGCTDIQNVIEANAIYVLIPLLRQIKVDEKEIERLKNWSKEMWPLMN